MTDRYRLIVPPHVVRYYPEGQHSYDAHDGDLLLVRHATDWADVISAGEEALTVTQPELKGYTWTDHSAIIRHGDDGHDVSQMGPGHGYERADLWDYKAKEYVLVQWPAVSASDIARAMAYDESFSDVDYGWGEYLTEIADGLTDAKFVASWGDSTICSGHATMVLMALGLFPDRPPNAVVPAHLALWTGARSTL